MDKSFDLTKLLKIHQKKHKSKPSHFGSVASGVQKRLASNLKNRKSSRLSYFDSIRDLPRCESPAPLSAAQLKAEHRRQQLEKWKVEKEKKKKEIASQKKKPFLAGVANAPLKFVPPPIPKAMPSTSGRVTRSQTARHSNRIKDQKASQSFAPNNATFKAPELKNISKLKMAPNKTKTNITFEPVVPKTKEINKQTRSKTQKQTETKVVEKQPEKTSKAKLSKPNTFKAHAIQSSSSKSIQSSSSSEVDNITSPILMKTQKSPIISQKSRKSVQRTPKNPVPKSESSSEERLRSPKSSSEEPMTPAQIVDEVKKISPCVTMSRGKDNARREMKKKLEEGLLDDDASDMHNVDHFRRQLASEIKRITEMCETWDKISEQTVLPEGVQEAVLGAVGQARLLMTQKLQQFATLVERCARPEPGTALVTPADLHGFWDMVFMQVENVDMRFKKLEEMRSRGWVEPQPIEVQKKAAAKPHIKKPIKSSGGPSRLREMIAAARKAKKEQETEQQTTPAVSIVCAEADSKTFEAGFFCVRSPVKSPAAPQTPAAKNSLLKAVLSSEARKASASKNTASFAMLRASVLGKNVECDGITLMPQTPITPINPYATPGRSILKQSSSKSGKKSIKVVLFDQSDTDADTYLTPESETNEITKDFGTDSGLSSMDLEKVDDKENSRRKSKLVRQDAEDRSPVMTRSRRKSMNVSVDAVVTPRRSRKKVLQESEENIAEIHQSGKKSSRRRKSGVQN